ncbi:hypothetical protein Tco_1212828 [Tanacetum coccineum]
MEYLVNISKRRVFWSLNEDILKITILKTNTPYPSRKIRRIHACTHQRPQRKEDQYAVLRLEEKLEQQRKDGVRHEIALRKKFEDQREDDHCNQDEGNDGVEIIIANIIPPDHVDDVLVVEPNQPNVVPVIPEPVLVDEDEDPKEEEFEEEEEPQEEEDDTEVDIEEDENEPELTYPYKKVDPLNLPPPVSDSEPEDVIEIEDTVKPKDETVPASVHEVGESSTAPFLREDSDGLFPGFMRMDINSLFVRSSVEEDTAAMKIWLESLVMLKKELSEMIRRGIMFEERSNEVIVVPVKDEESPSSEPRGSFCDS